MRNLSVLIKPVSSACNMDCRYCFYKDEARTWSAVPAGFMSEDTLETMVKRCFDFAGREVDFVFQGGEPTLCGLAFYETFIGYVEKYNRNHCKCIFNLQTNGLNLDDRWYSFLKKNHFLVGISYDGLPQIHDSNRVVKTGSNCEKGTSETVESAIRNLQRYGVDYNVLMVVTAQAAGRAAECYAHLKALGVSYMQIIPALDPYMRDFGQEEYSLSPEALGDFLTDLYQCWQSDRTVHVTYFENILSKMCGKPQALCSMNGQCQIEMVIEKDGSVYPCDFYVQDYWKLGSIRENSFEEILKTQRARDFVEESIDVNADCRKCRWFGFCIGACKRYKMGHAFRYENHYCSGYRKFFSCLSASLREK